MNGGEKEAWQAHKAALERFYNDVCTVYEYRDVKDEETKITGKEEVAVLVGEPCRISFQSPVAAGLFGNAAEKKASIKLFLSPRATIKAGSKIVVTHEGETTAYGSSGVPGRFATHQEVALELFERWA